MTTNVWLSNYTTIQLYVARKLACCVCKCLPKRSYMHHTCCEGSAKSWRTLLKSHLKSRANLITGIFPRNYVILDYWDLEIQGSQWNNQYSQISPLAVLCCRAYQSIFIRTALDMLLTVIYNSIMNACHDFHNSLWCHNLH